MVHNKYNNILIILRNHRLHAMYTRVKIIIIIEILLAIIILYNSKLIKINTNGTK